MANIANIPAGTRPSADGKWIHCGGCSKAYWGSFRPTDFIAAKFTAHVERKHAAQAGVEAGADAPADAQLSDHAGFVPAVVAKVQARQAKNAKADARAAKKGDGPVRIVRLTPTEGPRAEDLLGQAMADILNDMGGELNPRLQLAQGPRNFTDERERDRREPVKVANNGQAAMARAQAACSPLKGWA